VKPFSHNTFHLPSIFNNIVIFIIHWSLHYIYNRIKGKKKVKKKISFICDVIKYNFFIIKKIYFKIVVCLLIIIL